MSSAKAAIWLDLITSGIAESSDTEGCGLLMADCRLQTLQMIMRDAKKCVLTKTTKKEHLDGNHETFFPS